MVIPAVGRVVLVPFPFSDLSQSKVRPAVLLADTGHSDWLLCQITSNAYGDSRAVALTAGDFQVGSLRLTSYVRPSKLFTAHGRLLVREVGTLKADKLRQVLNAVIQLLRASLPP